MTNSQMPLLTHTELLLAHWARQILAYRGRSAQDICGHFFYLSCEVLLL